MLQLLARFAKLPEGKEASLIEKIFRTTIKYVVLGRTAIVVIICTAIIAVITGDGTPPVHVAGKHNIYWRKSTWNRLD